MNETLKAAGHIGAELGAARAENARLRKALQGMVDFYGYAEQGPIEAARAALSQQAEPVEPAPAQDELLADRMRAAGMMTVDEMLAGAPLDRFIKHAGVNDLETYSQWLDMKCREFLSLQASRDLDKREDDDLYEWVLAHAAVFQEARINFNAARPAQTEQQQAVARIGAVMSRKQRLFSIDILKPEFLDVGTELFAAPIAQTAEAEGVEFPIARFLDHKREGAEWMVRAVDHDAALSAVTAERDAIAARLAEWERSTLVRENVELTAEVEALRKVKTAHALHAAVGAIYFDDNSDFGSALWEVVRSLAPDLVDELELNPSAVWHKTEAMAAKEE